MSRLWLCKNTKLDTNYESTIDFEDKEAQVDYFLSKVVSVPTVDELTFSYLKKGNDIDIEANVETLEGVDYCMALNDDKYYFYFIDDIEFRNKDVARLHVTLDVFQTYMFDYSLGNCYVEREHQDRFNKEDDTLITIKSLTDENINYGNEYKLISNEQINEYNYIHQSPSDRPANISYLLIWSNEQLIDGNDFPTMIDGLVTSRFFYIIPIYSGNRLGFVNTTKLVTFGNISHIYDSTIGWEGMNSLQKLREINSVVEIQLSRYSPIGIEWRIASGGEYEIKGYDNDVRTRMVKLKDTYGGHYAIKVDEQIINHSISYYTSTIGYERNVIPALNMTKNINNEPKLLNYPYNFYKVRYGDYTMDYKPQYFNNNIIAFNSYKSLAEVSAQLFVPKDYRGTSLDYDNMVVAINSNEMALTTDAYKNYMAQNKAQFRTGLITGVLGSVGSAALGVATGGIGLALGGGAAISSASQIANSIAKISDLKSTPDTTRQTGDDIGVATYKNNIYASVEHYNITDEAKSRVFNYLYRNGYSVKDYKIPNTKSRYYFNYIKNIETYINSNVIDRNVAEELKSIYNNGITIWHYHNNDNDLFNYTLENWETNLL